MRVSGLQTYNQKQLSDISEFTTVDAEGREWNFRYGNHWIGTGIIISYKEDNELRPLITIKFDK
jgi:hypothetical protein